MLLEVTIQGAVSGTLMLKAGSRGSQGFSKSSAVSRGPEAVFVTVGEAKSEILGMACLVLTLMDKYCFSQTPMNKNFSSITKPLYIIPISFLGLYTLLEMRCPDLTICFATRSESPLLVFPELVRVCEMFRRLVSIYITSE